MICQVCDTEIRIDSLKQLFAWKPLLLCGRCAPHLIPKSGRILFEDNDWISGVIDKLNQGDLVLLALFEQPLKKALKKQKINTAQMLIIEDKKELTYPWLKILVDRVAKSIQIDEEKMSTETLIVAVKAQAEGDNQLILVG